MHCAVRGVRLSERGADTEHGCTRHAAPNQRLDEPFTVPRREAALELGAKLPAVMGSPRVVGEARIAGEVRRVDDRA